MNSPQFYLVDELEIVVAAVKSALAIPVLNYQYGYLDELNETLDQYNLDPASYDQKYPLVWLVQPFEIVRGSQTLYGIARNLRLFIINHSSKDLKAKERMNQNLKAIVYPIYSELLKQINDSPVFSTMGIPSIKHSVIDRYWIKDLGLDDVVDCVEMRNLELQVNDNFNCVPLNN